MRGCLKSPPLFVIRGGLDTSKITDKYIFKNYSTLKKITF